MSGQRCETCLHWTRAHDGAWWGRCAAERDDAARYAEYLKWCRLSEEEPAPLDAWLTFPAPRDAETMTLDSGGCDSWEVKP
jgi:hypothetical protein